MMLLKDFINKYNKKFVDFDGRYGDQCVDLARAYINEVLGFIQPRGVVGAKDFFEKFESDPKLVKQFTKIKNTLLFVPRAGDIMIWTGKYGPYGHIAICTGNGNKLYFEAFSQNDPHGSPCIIKKYVGYKNVHGVLRPKDLIAEWQKFGPQLDFEVWKMNFFKSLNK